MSSAREVRGQLSVGFEPKVQDQMQQRSGCRRDGTGGRQVLSHNVPSKCVGAIIS